MSPLETQPSGSGRFIRAGTNAPNDSRLFDLRNFSGL